MLPRTYCPQVRRRAERAELAADLQDVLARFGRALQGLGRSPATRRLYLGSVRRWLLAGGRPDRVDDVVLGRWLAEQRERVSQATLNLHVKALRAFYRLQAEFGDAEAREAARLPKLRVPPPRLPRVLTPEQVGEVLGTLPLHTFVGVRDHAIILMLFATGLRAGELARLELGDLLDDGSIYVRAGKGGRDRYVPMTPDLRQVLDAYLAARRTVRPGKRVALWFTRDGKPLANGRSVWEIVQGRIRAALGRRAGWHAIAKAGRPWQGHYPHMLRASFATALLAGGCPITAIAQMLGHADVATTAHYLGVDLTQLRQALEHHPRARRQEQAAAHRADAPDAAAPKDPARRPARPAPDRSTGTVFLRSKL